MQTRLNNERANAVAEITVQVAKILDDTTLLGVTGTLAAKTIELTNIGTNDAVTMDLSNCNIGGVTLTTCFGHNAAAIATTLDLSHNRMDAAAISGLVQDLYDAIVTGASHSVLTLDLHGNAVPNTNTMAEIHALCTAMVTGAIACDAPVTVTATGVTDPTTAGVYTYTAASGNWINPGGDEIHHNGTNYILTDAGAAHTWTGPVDSIYGTYTLADHASIVVS